MLKSYRINDFILMEIINLLGSSSLVGRAFILENNSKFKIIPYSRFNKKYRYLDISNFETFKNIEQKHIDNSFIVSFAPVWITSKFLQNLMSFNSKYVKKLKGVLLCSSTSVKTKRFSVNKKDKQLVNLLLNEEKKIKEFCFKNEIPCIIIRPTMIYGQVDNIYDKNLYKVSNLFRKLPVVFIPASTGYRQPIHAIQLAKLFEFYLNQFTFQNKFKAYFEIIEVGGDEILSYKEMLKRLLHNQSGYSIKSKTKLITIKNFCFYIFIFPILLFKPEIFEMLFRIGADLSGFPSYSSLTGHKAVKFPYSKYI
tara:strand:- start:1179 stop:2108 length:930 start_codon:yes stop_codon:yes gene_type:complete